MVIAIPLSTYLAALLSSGRSRPPVLALTTWSAVLLTAVNVGQWFAWAAFTRQIDGKAASFFLPWMVLAALVVRSGAMAMLAERVRLDRRRWLMSIVAPLAP